MKEAVNIMWKSKPTETNKPEQKIESLKNRQNTDNSANILISAMEEKKRIREEEGILPDKERIATIQEQLQKRQKRTELSLEEKLNDLRKVHNELDLSQELRKAEEEELISQYPNPNKRTGMAEVSLSPSATDNLSHQIDEIGTMYDNNKSSSLGLRQDYESLPEPPIVPSNDQQGFPQQDTPQASSSSQTMEDLENQAIDWKVDNLDYGLAVNLYSRLPPKNKIKENFGIIRNHVMDMAIYPNYIADNRDELRKAFKDLEYTMTTDLSEDNSKRIIELRSELNRLNIAYNQR